MSKPNHDDELLTDVEAVVWIADKMKISLEEATRVFNEAMESGALKFYLLHPDGEITEGTPSDLKTHH